MRRRILCFFLCAVVLLSVLPAQAAQGDFITRDFRSGVCITQYSGSDSAVTIPSKLNGKAVVGIDNAAFSGNQAVTTLSIPGSVTFLGIPGSPEEKSIALPYFMESPHLTEISVASDNPVFCSVDGVLFTKDRTELLQYPCAAKRTSYTVPTGVHTIAETAFQNAAQLRNITFPFTLNTIGDSAFERCTALQSVELPLSVTALGGGAFQRCNAMTEIRIGNPQCRIGGAAATIPVSAKIYGYNGSTAQAYATAQSRTFVPLGAFDKATCTHPEYTSKEIKAATCTENGVLEHTCTTCGHTYLTQVEKNPDNHNPQAIPDRAATCTESGHSGGTVCSRCGKQLTSPKVVPAPGHTAKTTTGKATAKQDGFITTACIHCGKTLSRKAIPYPKTITLSKARFTYNGKAKNPTVTVIGSDGNPIPAENYRLTYSAGRKNVGEYTLRITFTGSRYSGTITKPFTIQPAATSIAKRTAARKGFTVKWKKKTAQTTGYQVQYAANRKFTKATTKTIAKTKTVSCKISGQKAKTKYYVRVRTYHTVSGKSYYSNWSKVKTIQTK